MEEEIVELFSADQDPWDQVYHDVRLASEVTEMRQGYSTSVAEQPDNWRLNRWRDVKPYDHSRVVIRDHPNTDYINANLVTVSKADRSYILTQGPLPSTVGHFWLMVWQNNTKAILMLNRIFEKGVLKCHQYWPEGEGSNLECDELREVGLTLKNVSSKSGKHYTVRTLRLTHDESGESREIFHFHYTTWPDFGVPKCPDSFLEFLNAVKSSGSLESNVGPAVVHCSAGVGRSGTFCLVDSCLVMLEKEDCEGVKIQELLVEMRQHRMRLIQTKEQLKFSYVAIAVGGNQRGLWNSNTQTDNESSQRADKLSEICSRLSEPTRNGDGHSGSDTSSSDDDDSFGNGNCPPPPPPRTQSLNHQADAVLSLLAEIESMRSQSQQSQEVAPAAPETAVNGTNSHHSEVEEEEQATNHEEGLLSSRPDHQLPAPPPDSGSPQHSNASSEESVSSLTVSSNQSASNSQKYILNDHKLQERKTEVELRRRLKAEKQAEMESKIAAIKSHMKETEDTLAKASEEREKWRRFVVDKAIPMAVGMAMFVIGTGYFFYYPR